MRARGFTLIEVMVALTIGALVVLLAHRTFAVATDLEKRLTVAREAHDRAINARRFLSSAFGSLDVVAGGGLGFQGRAEEVAFATWLPAADGALARRAVTLRIESAGRIVALVRPIVRGADFAPDTLVLVPRASGLALDYLLEYGADAQWVREWRSPVSAPLAVRLRIARLGPAGAVDTLLFAIGPRG